MGIRTKKILKASFAFIFVFAVLFGSVQINAIVAVIDEDCECGDCQPAQVRTIRLIITPHVNDVVYNGSMTMTLIPRDAGGNLQWDSAITIPETNMIDVPRNVDYLFRIEPDDKNHYMVPTGFTNSLV